MRAPPGRVFPLPIVTCFCREVILPELGWDEKTGKGKGFTVKIVEDEAAFVTELEKNSYREVWFDANSVAVGAQWTFHFSLGLDLLRPGRPHASKGRQGPEAGRGLR
jgi:hypothetical protein